MATTYPFSPAQAPKEYRAGGRGRPPPRNGAAYTRRRRSAARAQVVQVPAWRRFWDEHALKAGICGFWLWFAAANSGALLSAFH